MAFPIMPLLDTNDPNELTPEGFFRIAASLRNEYQQDQRFLETLKQRRVQNRLNQEKFAADRYDKAVSLSKETFGKLTNLYGRATSTSEKEHIAGVLRSMRDSFPPVIQQALSAWIDNSPISAEEEKLRLFIQHNPMPQAPQRKVNLRGEPLIEEVTPQEQAEYDFSFDDWKRNRDTIIFGKGVRERLNFIPYEGAVATRDSEGRIRVLSDSDLKIRDVAEELKTTPGMLKFNGGYFSTGQQYKKIIGDKLVTYEIEKDVLGFNPKEPVRWKEVSVNKSPLVRAPAAYPDELENFMRDFFVEGQESRISVSFTGKTKKNFTAVAALDMVKDEIKGGVPQGSTNNFLRTVFPGYSFRIVRGTGEGSPEAAGGILRWIAEFLLPEFLVPNTKDNFRLIPVRGILRELNATGTDGKPIRAWVDEGGDVYDGLNIYQGHVDSFGGIRQ